MQRNSIRAASSFVGRNHLPPRLKQQILAYMCLKFRAESLNQQQLMDQLPKSICKSICEHLFVPVVKDVYLFNGVSREMLLSLVTKMKPEYIPPKEDVIVQNEAPDDVYVVVSGELDVIVFDGIDERVEATLGPRDIFGEVSALSDRAQAFTFRTRTLSQLLRLKQATLKEAMQSRPEDSVVIIKNFLKVTSRLAALCKSLNKLHRALCCSWVITETVALLVSVCVAASGRDAWHEYEGRGLAGRQHWRARRRRECADDRRDGKQRLTRGPPQGREGR